MGARKPCRLLTRPPSYDTGATCDTKVKFLLSLFEKMLEDMPSDASPSPLYTAFSTCAPSALGSSFHVQRAKLIFHLIKNFVAVPSTAAIQAQSLIMAKAGVDAADELAEGFEEEKDEKDDQ